MDHIPIRTIIVDDEALGRQAVRGMLCDDDRFEILTECSGGEDAINQVGSLSPDLMFLDIQMPEVDGFDVLTTLGKNAPIVVMVTAFDEYAIRAFEHHALDYVSKPIDPDRFKKTLDHVVQRVRERRAGQGDTGLANLLRDLDPTNKQTDRIVLKAAGALLCLQPEELKWIESASNYVKLHVDSREYLVRETMAGMSQRLDPARFVRIHRSFIVNLLEVRELRTDRLGAESVVILRDGTELSVGRSNREQLEALLEKR